MTISTDFSTRVFLMWKDTLIGTGTWGREKTYVKLKDSLPFPVYSIVGYRKELDYKWFYEFMSSRLPSSDRKDINKILKRAGLKNYDLWELAKVTRLVNPQDLLWISFDDEETIEDVFSGNMNDLFKIRVQDNGDSPYSPNGMNTKRFALVGTEYGILKSPIIKRSYDHIAEVASYRLAKLLGVNCCKAFLYHEDGHLKVFSKFEYDFLHSFITPMKRYVSSVEDNLLDSLVAQFPLFEIDFYRIVLFDFIIRQDDRHMGNLAIEHSLYGEVKLYPLYDNGRSLFYEDDLDFIRDALGNEEIYCTNFGAVGSYWDHVERISQRVRPSKLLNLNVSFEEVYECLSDFDGEQQELVSRWVYNCIQKVKSL